MQGQIMIIGGDNTSDRFGAALARQIRGKQPGAALFGVGGPLMNEAEVRLVFEISEMVSLGVFQSLKSSQVVKRMIKRVMQAMDSAKPALVLQIGMPVFGLKLLEMARAKNIPTLYYYSPLCRGLDGAKLERFGRLVDKVASISRQETALCHKAGIDVEFVGHPLLDLFDRSPGAVHDEARSESGHTITVLPGTLEVEVRSLLPTVLKALERVKKQDPELRCIIAVAPTVRAVFMDELLKNLPELGVVLDRDIYGALRRADLAITTIGTCSLEAALLGVPSLAVCKAPRSFFLTEKLFDRGHNLTITNNILRKTVVPEYTRGDFNQAKIAAGIQELLKNAEARQAMLTEFERLQEELGAPGSIGRAADLVLEMAGCFNGT